MAGEDDRRRSRRKHRQPSSSTHISSSDKRTGDNAKNTNTVEQTGKPVDQAAVRKARLEYLEKPAEETNTKMKYVWERPIARRTSSAGEVRSEKKRPTVARQRTEEAHKSHRRKTQRDRSEQTSSGDEYVYGKTSTAVEKPSTSVSKFRGSGSAGRKATSRRTTSEKPTSDRISTKRRRTGSLRKSDDTIVEEEISSGDENTRPTPRRSATDPSTAPRPATKHRTTCAHPRTEVSVVKSISPSKHERKSSGIFAGLLTPQPRLPEKQISCLTCGSDDIPVSKSAKLPCSHRMCHACLKRIFKMSVTDPAHMPPRCCTQDHIDLKHVDKLFDQNFKKTWNRRFEEYKTKNRIYCPARKCGEWIKPNHITVENGRRIGKCKKCGTRVCAICNNKAHSSRDCPKDPATKQFAEIAKQSGWQKCYNCSATVELKEGCNHMTCRCQAEFCMVCGLRWKSCDCPWFNYEQIDAHLGNPVRYQQELDRRRDQETRDEHLARRMQQLGVGDMEPNTLFGVGNAAGHHMNQNFIQQAREALTANYQNAEQAARGLVYNWVTGRENRLPDDPTPANHVAEQERDRDAPHTRREEIEILPVQRPSRRTTARRRSAIADLLGARPQATQERDTERRIHNWANNVTQS